LVKKGQWVAVFWEDIVGVERPWLSSEEALQVTPAPMVTLGVLLSRSKECVVVASTLELSQEDPHVGSVCCIPTGAIQSLIAVPMPQEAKGGR
jgi:hypothetical protein